jgi:heme/copper-type cytochrome/quinol oxidase subunit 4
MALAALTIATVSSFALARRVMYETFLILHIVFITLFLVGCFMHRPKKSFQPWIIVRQIYTFPNHDD